MTTVKQAIRWVFLHEPALLAGVAAGIAIFFSIRYGSHAGGAVQGLGGGSVALAFGVLRNFVTSPAGKQALDTAQGDIAQLPALVDDVTRFRAQLEPAIGHPAGLLGVLTEHTQAVQQIAEDMIYRVQSMVRSSAPAADVQPSAPAAPDGEPTDALDELGKLAAQEPATA